ncbi:MAG: RING finger domain-containing protein [Nitrososphaerota archaeon]|nr:RING finger domain-containing protein [Nitrososphaerota archaeon]
MGLEVSSQAVLGRFFKLALIVAGIGAVHILTLFMSWYTVVSDAITTTAIQGYAIAESLYMSIAGGIVCGIALLLSSTSSNIITAKWLVGTTALVGALLAIASPAYAHFMAIPALQAEGYLEIGIFMSYLSAIAMFIPATTIIATPIKVEVIPSVGPPYLETSAPAVEEAIELVHTTDVPPGAVCGICYQDLDPETTMMCSDCQTLFHKGCIDVWVNLNGTCPSCKKPVVR